MVWPKKEQRFQVYKTAWFAKSATKARITDAELFQAACELVRGQAADLGGGVFKKRLNGNRHRSIVLAGGADRWVFVYLFSKQNKAGLEPDELAMFRRLAAAYGRMSEAELSLATTAGDLKEIRQ